MPAPFRFCLHCGVAYEFRQTSDFAKLASLASEGRSTATTILSLSAIRSLRNAEDFPEHARKLLSFTDNRQATHALRRILDGLDVIRPHLDDVATAHGDELLDAHRRVRIASRTKGVSYRVQPILPPDVLGYKHEFLHRLPTSHTAACSL